MCLLKVGTREGTDLQDGGVHDDGAITRYLRTVLSRKSGWVILRISLKRADLRQKCQKFSLTVALVSILSCGAATAQAASLKVGVDPEGRCSALTLSGEIQRGDQKTFAASLKEATLRAPLRRLYLNSSGGDILSALAISNIIRDLVPNIETIVESRNICNSACILVLASGAKQKVSSEASIIVHLAYDPDTGLVNLPMSMGMAHILVNRGMSEDVVKTVEDLKPGQTVAITASNAKQRGYTTLTFFGGSQPPATEGCSWPGFRSKG